jgi:drug/metabolite transporter (DMT)-like permease
MRAIALGFAALGAVGYGAASVLQAIGAGQGIGTLQTLSNPWYLVGLVLDLLAWLASLVALRRLPVYEVQAILAGSIAVTVLLARIALSHRLRRADLAAILVTIAALVALAASSGPQRPTDPSTIARLVLAGTAVPIAVAGWAAARAELPNVTGALAGLAFGGAALCARAVRLPSHKLAVHEIATDPLAWGLIGFGIIGMLLYAMALEHGDVGPVTALLWITEVIAPSIVGAWLLGDTVRAGWLPVAGVALVAATAAAGVLAMSRPVNESSVSDPESVPRRGVY